MPKAKRYKAQAFDKMQYFYREAHEPLIHCMIRLSGHLDDALLEKAVTLDGAVSRLVSFPVMQRLFHKAFKSRSCRTATSGCWMMRY